MIVLFKWQKSNCYCIKFNFPANFRAYDRAAIKFRGLDADINFNVADYHDDLKQVCRIVNY